MMDQVQASRAVLIEVINTLGAFKDDIVLVGGWVPDLMFPNQNHIGSLDVDLAIGPGAVGSNVYTTIWNRLKEQGYSLVNSPTRFYRSVPGAAERVKVDLISGQYVGSEKADWIHVDELQINTLRGVDLALEAFEEITIEGNMPDGTHNVVRARIARAEAFVLIKAFALAERSKEKDAYDIAFVLQHYFPSVEVLAERMRALLGNGLAQQGYAILTEKFARIDSVGPSGAANEAERNGGDFEQVRRAAYEYAQGLFAAVAGLGT